jgi:UDP-glucose 4-epimerase
LGNGQGFSIQEVIEAARVVTNRPIPVTLADRRPGDPPILVGSGEKAQRLLGWQPEYADLKTILAHAWQWHQQRHGNA